MSYDAVDSRRRTYQTWNVQKKNSDRDDLPALDKLRPLCRDAYRNQPIVVSAVDTTQINVIGAGLKLQATPNADILGISAEEASQWAKQVEAEFRLFAENVNCDAERKKDFYQLQKVALISAFVSGDIPFLLPYIDRDGAYSLSVQLLEADRLCNPNNQPDTPETAGGITVGRWGEPITYHFAKTHPGGLTLPTEWISIPAFGENGRRNVYLLAEYVRPEQRRGIPKLAPVLESLKNLSEYTKAELEATVVSALFTVFIKQENNSLTEPIKNEQIKLEPGMMVALNPGEDIESINPNRPNPNYDKFVEAILKEIGSALQIPYELLMKHFSSSYSASRAALLEAWKSFRARRQWFAKGFCQPIYEEFLVEGILNGRIEAPGFFDDPLKRMAWSMATWNGPTPGQLDPIKETRAAEMRVQSGFSTRTQETAEMNGGDFETNAQMAKRETQLMIDAGLKEQKIQKEQK